MPELPEVETVARQLRPHLVGRQIHAVRILDSKLACVKTEQRTLLRGVFTNVQRIGKRIELELRRANSAPIWLLVHLRMTGRLIFSPSPIPPETKYLRAIFELDRGWLVFQDTRRFGTIELVEDAQQHRGGALDPLSRRFTPGTFKQLLTETISPIKVWLLRQDRLAGMGNIYASESLFEAGIHPTRPGRSLDAVEVQKLHGAIREVLRRSIRAGGTTFSDFRDGHGRSGNFARRLKVYDRADEPCRACGVPISRIVQAQRSTFFCPKCQK